jgi:translation elongation factor P/translation initiation factor 5A
MSTTGTVVTKLPARSLKKGMVILMEGYQFEIIDIHASNKADGMETAYLKWSGKGHDPGTRFRRTQNDFPADQIISVIGNVR